MAAAEGPLRFASAQPLDRAELSAAPLRSLPRPSLLAVMNAVDVFVRPTYFDGDACSVREALALGRKVVATSVGHRPAEVRLVPPGDSQALAQALIASSAEPSVHSPAGGPDGVERILSLYGVPSCAASAAS
jgi:glycosyltransferase involved in cell wall biosynthesis